MLRIAFPALLAATILASPAYASEPTTGQAEAKAKPVKEKKVCKTDTATGSIMAKRTCRTKAEWAAMEEQAKSDMDRMRQMDQSKALVGATRGQ